MASKNIEHICDQVAKMGYESFKPDKMLVLVGLLERHALFRSSSKGFHNRNIKFEVLALPIFNTF